MTFETMTSEQYRSKHRELEADFQAWVIDMARLAGLIPFHWPDSRRVTESGWPDLTLLGTAQIIFAELKREGETRTPAQVHIGGMLERIAWRVKRPWVKPPPVQYFVWQPSDRPAILDVFGLPQSYLGDGDPVDVEPPMPGLLEGER